MDRVVAILRRRRLGARPDGLRAVTAVAWSPLIPISLTCIRVLVPQGLLRVGEPSYRGIAARRRRSPDKDAALWHFGCLNTPRAWNITALLHDEDATMPPAKRRKKEATTPAKPREPSEDASDMPPVPDDVRYANSLANALRAPDLLHELRGAGGLTSTAYIVGDQIVAENLLDRTRRIIQAPGLILESRKGLLKG